MLRNRKHYSNNRDASFVSNKKYGINFSVSKALQNGQIKVSTGKTNNQITPEIELLSLTGQPIATIGNEELISI